MIDWQVPGNELRDNPVVRQAPPGRVKAGEVRRYATGDPFLLMPGDIYTAYHDFLNTACFSHVEKRIIMKFYCGEITMVQPWEEP